MVCAALFLSLAVAATTPVHVRPRVVIHTNVKDETLVATLTEAVEEAIPVFEGFFDTRFPRDETMVIHLYGTIQPFRDKMKAIEVRGFDSSGAVTTWNERESFIVVQPRSEPEYLEEVGHVPRMTLQLVLHEVVHQFVAKAKFYPPEYTPAWYNEGVPEYLTWQLMTDQGKEPPPLNLASKCNNLATAVEDNKAARLDALFAQGFAAAAVESYGNDLLYAQGLSLIRFFHQPGERRWRRPFEEFHRSLGRRGEPNAYTIRLDELKQIDSVWRSALGKRKLEALEEDWHEFAAADRHGSWYEELRSSEWRDGSLVTAALSFESNALVVSQELPGAEVELHSGFRILPIEEGQAEFVIHRRSGENLKVTVRRDGWMKVLAFQGQWLELAKLEIPTMEDDRWHRMQIRRSVKTVTAVLDQAHKLEAKTPEGFDFEQGRIGVGAYKAAVLYRDLELNGETLRP